MKRLTLLAMLLISTYAYSAAQPMGDFEHDDESQNIRFECTMYTKNQVFEDKSTTDNPPKKAKTVVTQNPEGFTVLKGSVFPHTKVLTNAQSGSASGMAGDPTTLLLLRADSRNVPFFVIYQFKSTQKNGKPATPAQPGPVEGLIVLAGCTHD